LIYVYIVANNWTRYFWHQSFRAFLTANTDLFITSTRRHSPTRTPTPTPRRGSINTSTSTSTISSRYIRYFICFGISGLIHLLLDHAIGIPLHDSGAMQFLLLQPLAFAVEDTAAYLAANRSIPGMARGERISRAIGYIWVTAFSLWSWRPWALPVLRTALEVGEPITSIWFLGLGAGGRIYVV
jgi:hypothetical protein